MEETKTVALFIDAENLIRPIEERIESFNLSIIIARLREEGRIIVSRAYGDWSKSPCRNYVREFSSFGIETMEVFSDSRGKNTADILIAADMMELCFSAPSPDIFAIISGDRDFVPLVQRLRRHGKIVIGLGVEEATSEILKNTCDTYINYHSLMEKPIKRIKVVASDERKVQSPQETSSATSAETTDFRQRHKAFTTLVKAIRAIVRRGTSALGSNTHLMMRQLSPEFDFQLLGYQNFKEFIIDGEQNGFVRITYEVEGSGDFAIDVSPNARVTEEDIHSRTVLSFETAEDARDSYLTIFKQKRVPWVPWKYRGTLVRCLWDYLSSHPEGIPMFRMTEFLISYIAQREWPIAEEAVQKIIYSLNIGRCFVDANQEYGETRIQDLFNIDAGASVEIEEAFGRMHMTYLRGIRLDYPEAVFTPEAVSLLLFDTKEEGQHLDMAESLIGQLGAG
ncbi:MAG: NYN domain-containing protein [Candidatus Electryoneaceae bacterium]|nr:NYN domain-containing protein [Candidatus Electryoneaceae bacterium]